MIDFLLGTLFGFVLYRFTVFVSVYFLEKRIEEKVEQTMKEIRKSLIPSKIEYTNGVYYMFNRETDEFLAQGKTFDELEKVAREKHPNKLFNVPKEELQLLMKDKNETI
jgi:hypothetical protein